MIWGKIQLFLIGKLGMMCIGYQGIIYRESSTRCYYDGTLTSTNGLSLVHCYPGVHEAGEPVGYLQLKA